MFSPEKRAFSRFTPLESPPFTAGMIWIKFQLLVEKGRGRGLILSNGVYARANISTKAVGAMFQCCLSACEVQTHEPEEVLELKAFLLSARRSGNRITYNDFQSVSNLRKIEIF
jgi:hypothetical protein